MIEKRTCPNCGKRTLPKDWYGVHPPVCNKCDHQAEKQPEVMY